MQNVLIVGASSGIGRTLADSLADSHRLYTASRRPAQSGAGRHITWDAVGGPFPAGFLPERLDGLVYCPGSITLQPLERLTLDTFRADFDLNLLGAVRVIQAALPALRAAPEASVVLFSTVAAGTGLPMHASIAAAKGAVEGFARALAAELAPRIRVNAVAPSLTDTPLGARLLRSERLREAAAGRHPLERVGQPADSAAAVRFLLSAEASWMTGQILHVDGGMGAVRRFG